MREFTSKKMDKIRDFFLSMVCSLVFFGNTVANAAEHSSVYVNEEMGIKVKLLEKWNIYTTNEEAPEEFKAYLPEEKRNNDSPLFLARTQDHQVYARLLVDQTNLDLQDYFVFLAARLETEPLEILEAKWVPDRNSIQWEYRSTNRDQGRNYFQERVTIGKNGYVFRLAFWSIKPFFLKHNNLINGSYQDVEILTEDRMSLTWNKPWAGLEGLLPPNHIAGIHIVEEYKASGLVCSDPTSTLLWKVQGESNTVHIFGSIHVGEPGFYPLSPEIEMAFNRSDHLVVEVNTHSQEFLESIRTVQARGTLADGTSLVDVLSEPVFQTVVDTLYELGLPPDRFLQYKPWFLAQIVIDLQITKLGYIREYGVETYLYEKKPEEMDILELESLEDQLQAFEGLDEELYLAYSLLSLKAMQAEVELLIKGWQCADKKKIHQLAFDEMASRGEDFSAIEQPLFFDRNMNFAKKIQEYLSNGDGDYFVVVGAAHLVGDKSVVALLKRSGYSVVPVKKANRVTNQS